MNESNPKPASNNSGSNVLPDRELEFFMDGNFDYYSKSKSKKYRGFKYRNTSVLTK